MSLQDSLEVEMKKKACSSYVPPTKAEGKEPHQTGSITLPPAEVSAVQSITSIDHHRCNAKWLLTEKGMCLLNGSWLAGSGGLHPTPLSTLSAHLPQHNVSGVIWFSLNVSMTISDLMDLG